MDTCPSWLEPRRAVAIIARAGFLWSSPSVSHDRASRKLQPKPHVMPCSPRLAAGSVRPRRELVRDCAQLCMLDEVRRRASRRARANELAPVTRTARVMAYQCSRIVSGAPTPCSAHSHASVSAASRQRRTNVHCRLHLQCRSAASEVSLPLRSDRERLRAREERGWHV